MGAGHASVVASAEHSSVDVAWAAASGEPKAVGTAVVRLESSVGVAGNFAAAAKTDAFPETKDRMAAVVGLPVSDLSCASLKITMLHRRESPAMRHHQSPASLVHRIRFVLCRCLLLPDFAESDSWFRSAEERAW